MQGLKSAFEKVKMLGRGKRGKKKNTKVSAKQTFDIKLVYQILMN